MSRCLLALSLLCSLPVLADAPSRTQWSGEVRWLPPSTFVFPSGDGTVLWDARTGSTREAREGEEAALEDALLLPRSRTAPDGKAKAEVKLIAPASAGTWKDEIFLPGGLSGAELRVERGGSSVLSRMWKGGMNSADTFWSPDGRYLAWAISASAWRGMDGSFPVDFTVGAGGGVRAQLLAAPAVLTQAQGRLLDAMEKAGLTPVFVGPAQKAREKTVIYAAKGFEAVAATLAKALPGGATVEALTWQAGVDVVVAAGKSTLGGGR